MTLAHFLIVLLILALFIVAVVGNVEARKANWSNAWEIALTAVRVIQLVAVVAVLIHVW
jgi:hypothetical protein